MATAVTVKPRIEVDMGRFVGPYAQADALPTEPALLVALDVAGGGVVRLVGAEWVDNARQTAQEARTHWNWHKQCVGCLMFATIGQSMVKSRTAQLHLTLLLDSLRQEIDAGR